MAWSYRVPSTSNLERFLECVTPAVTAKPLPQNSLQSVNSLWHPPGKETVEYFTLRDLWHCYDEWSAFGAGTSVVLSTGENIMKYYVPYLSAIQIYVNKSAVTSRSPRDDSDAVEFESDSSSEDSGSDEFSRSLSNNSSKTWDAASEDSSLEQEGAWPMRDRLGQLYMQYFETNSPYSRVPLMEKITELSQNHPALMTLRSVDLSPASWMAVAWYPIYHIPSRKYETDLSTCFLTYHTLSSCFQGANCAEAEEVIGGERKGKRSGEISLTPFGLATYKMHGDLWLNLENSDHERMQFLNSAADSWLKQLNIYHHDFNFFTCHSTM